jgi:hypothetical protein
MSHAQAPRANDKGDACPPWCTVDHFQIPAGLKYPCSMHISDSAMAVEGARVVGALRAKLVRGGYPYADGTVTPSMIWAGTYAADACISPADAEEFAKFLERLADATPAEVRGLAAAVRAVSVTLGDETAKADHAA